MPTYDGAWQHHAITDTVHQLAEQKPSIMYSAVRVKEGVVGKTYPFDRIGSIEMAPVLTRYYKAPEMEILMDKRRVAMKDFYVRVFVDDFDQIRTLPSLQSEKSQRLASSRNRQLDRLITAASIGNAVNVDEDSETTSTSALPAGQIIVDAGTGLTRGKVMHAKVLMDEANIDMDDRYFFYSSTSIAQLIDDVKVSSADFGTGTAIQNGGFGAEATWMGFKWRHSNLLPKTGNIRQNIAWAKSAMGLAVGKSGRVTVKDRPDMVDVTQVELTLSANAIRIEDAGVVRVDADESVVYGV